MIVTGETNSSRLNELKKFIATSEITKLYFSGGSWTNNGVDFSELEHSEEYIIYYINGIKFVDYLLDGRTTFEFNSVGTDSTINFTNLPYYKDPKKENIVSLPKIDNDVFIIRQQLSVYENNYLLEHIDDLFQLETFAAGNYFNIISNT